MTCVYVPIMEVQAGIIVNMWVEMFCASCYIYTLLLNVIDNIKCTLNDFFLIWNESCSTYEFNPVYKSNLYSYHISITIKVDGLNSAIRHSLQLNGCFTCKSVFKQLSCININMWCLLTYWFCNFVSHKCSIFSYSYLYVYYGNAGNRCYLLCT